MEQGQLSLDPFLQGRSEGLFARQSLVLLVLLLADVSVKNKSEQSRSDQGLSSKQQLTAMH